MESEIVIVLDYYRILISDYIFYFVYLDDINQFLCLLQVLITRRLVPIQVRSIGGNRPLCKRDTLVLRITAVDIPPHSPFSHPYIVCLLHLPAPFPSCFAALFRVAKRFFDS